MKIMMTYDNDDDDDKVYIMLKLMFKFLHVCVRDFVSSS